MLFRMIREIKVSNDWFGFVLVISRFNCVVVRVKFENEWNSVSVFLLSRL